MKKQLFSDDDPYLTNNELIIFTAEYLLSRGYCCGNGCLYCPYDYKNVVDLNKKKRLLEIRNKKIINERKKLDK